MVGEDQGVVPGELERHGTARLAVSPQHGHCRRIEVHHGRLATLGVAFGHLGALASGADQVNELIANGNYAKIFEKWGVAGTDEITKSTLNPTPTF